MSTLNASLPRPAPLSHPVPRREPRNLAAAAFGLIARWIDRTRQRDALAGLNDHLLRDIGITRVEAAREAEKPFWR